MYRDRAHGPGLVPPAPPARGDVALRRRDLDRGDDPGSGRLLPLLRRLDDLRAAPALGTALRPWARRSRRPRSSWRGLTGPASWGCSASSRRAGSSGRTSPSPTFELCARSTWPGSARSSASTSWSLTIREREAPALERPPESAYFAHGSRPRPPGHVPRLTVASSELLMRSCDSADEVGLHLPGCRLRQAPRVRGDAALRGALSQLLGLQRRRGAASRSTPRAGRSSWRRSSRSAPSWLAASDEASACSSRAWRASPGGRRGGPSAEGHVTSRRPGWPRRSRR